MRTTAQWMLVGLVAAIASPLAAQGLQGLGKPRGLLETDPKAVAFEIDILAAINGYRGKKKLPSLAMQQRLRLFVRREAEKAAKGEISADDVHAHIKKQGMAPYGYYLHFVYGTKASQVMRGFRKDRGMGPALSRDFDNAGIGAFWVPAEGGYFQVIVLLTKDVDLRAGSPGLTSAQTDPVMNSALPGIKKCYDEARKSDPNLAGQIIFKVVIDGDGTVKEAAMLKSFDVTSFNRCALLAVAALKFPKPYKGKPVTLNHPISLAPPQGGRRYGSLTPTQIRGVFNTARFDFKACYDKRLEKKPRLAGTIEISLTVMPNGEASNVRISRDGLKDQALRNCALKRAEKLRFPRPKHDGEVDVKYPLTFAPPPKATRK